MRQGGIAFCNETEINSKIGNWGIFDDPSTSYSDGEQNIWYYDGTKVYMQIAKYLDELSWQLCAGYVKNAYRNWVFGMSDGATGPIARLGGWRVFPQGLAHDYLRTGDPLSREAVLRLTRNSAFAGSGGASTCTYSRETAYLINAFLAAEEMGEPRDARLAIAVDYALGHINQWFVQKVTCGGNEAAFMVGLTVDALIAYYEKTGDSRIPGAVRVAADGLWSMSWSPTDEGFSLNIYSNQTGQPDLNLLVAPMYAWVWQMTGETIYLQRGDTVFSAGVRRAYLGAGKHFAQNYRWSFSYVKWRSSPPRSIFPLVGFDY